MENTSKPQNGKHTENLYQAVFARSSDAMCLLKDNIFIDANQALFDLFGCTREEFFTSRPSTFYADTQPNGEFSNDVIKNAMAAALSGKPQCVEFVYYNSNDESVLTETTLSKIGHNANFYILATLRNLSNQAIPEQKISQSRQRILQQNKGLLLLNELSNELHGLYTEEKIFEKTADVIANVLKKPKISIFTTDQEKQLLYFKTARRHKNEHIEQLKIIPLNPKFKEYAEETGESIEIPNIRENDMILPAVKKVLLDMGFESMIIIPFMVKNTRSALLYLVYEEAGKMKANDMRVLTSISKTVSLALDNARTHSELEYMAHHDSLTGLGNRAFLHKEFKHRLLVSQHQTAALYLLDLDRFKEINDTLGHFTGDKLLQKIGPRLETSITEHDFFVSRLGGDEFVVCVAGVDTEENATSIASNILSCLHEPFQVDDISLEIDSSIGIALYPKDGEDSHALLRSADVAMYEAKKKGMGYTLYARDSDIHTPERLAMLAELGSSINSGQLYLHYQPKVNLHTHEVLGFEALARWTHPRLGELSPSIFVPLIETGNAIFQLTEEVLHQALMQQRQWRRDGFHYTVAVNLSARNLIDGRIVNLLEKLLKHYEVPKNGLELEITETALMQDIYLASKYLQQIYNLGIELTIDDFGTGYSSLAYLQQLPVSKIKLDRTFIMEMLNSEQGENIVKTIIQLAKELNLQVIAEGVEDQATLNKLRDMQCNQAQGYFICKPNAWEHIQVWLNQK